MSRAITRRDFLSGVAGREQSAAGLRHSRFRGRRFPKGNNAGAPKGDPLCARRHELFARSFESIERETRLQLGGILIRRRPSARSFERRRMLSRRAPDWVGEMPSARRFHSLESPVA